MNGLLEHQYEYEVRVELLLSHYLKRMRRMRMNGLFEHQYEYEVRVELLLSHYLRRMRMNGLLEHYCEYEVDYLRMSGLYDKMIMRNMSCVHQQSLENSNCP